MTEQIISYSELFKWDTCNRQYYYRFGLGLRPHEESNAMTTGTKGHKFLQTFYEFLRMGNNKELALELVQQQASAMMKEEGFADFGLLQAWTLVDNYIRDNLFTREIELVENRFLYPAYELDPDPLLKNVLIGFTPDVVYKRKGGFYDVEDSKFVQRAWAKNKMDMFQQAKIYQILLQRMGYNVSRSAIRFFNVKTAVITEVPYELRGGEAKSITHDFVTGIKEVIRYRNLPEDEQKLARRTMNYPACQYCAFVFPCKLEREGKSANQTFKSDYVKSDYSYAD